MKEVFALLLSYFKRDLPQLWQQPLFLALFIVALLVAGLSYWILALILWVLFSAAIYLAKHYWHEEKGSRTVVAEAVIVEEAVVAQKKTTSTTKKTASTAKKSTAKNPVAKKSTTISNMAKKTS